MSHKQNDLGRDPIGPLLMRLALPTICAQVVNLLYSIVDRIYIGQLFYLLSDIADVHIKSLCLANIRLIQIGRASCRERV